MFDIHCEGDTKSAILSLIMVANPNPSRMRDDDPDAQFIRKECFTCVHRREVPYNAHIQCVKPDAAMTGNPHGIERGWFMYPLLFDPTWKTKKCRNYEDATDREPQSVVPSVTRRG